MNVEIYPLQFDPILKERIWGGEKLKTILDKPIVSKITGESWELSAVNGDVSQISEGIFKGKSLAEVIDTYPIEILGSIVYARFGKQFPLLFKYLDAKEALSIQVHPNDELAKKRHNSFGKTEMWYIVQADQEAEITVGFEEKTTVENYLRHVENNTLLSVLERISVKKGDAFFLETGTVHAIGAGVLLAEIQQTSDITYRIYDFDRLDANGNKRDLHVDLSLEAINYDVVRALKKYDTVSNTSNAIVSCPYFSTNFIDLDGTIPVCKTGSTFTVYMCTNGEFKLHYNDLVYKYLKGDTVLIPAAIKQYELIGKASLLEVYIL
jgi:mannose-6-phosphate isomerase